jgi:hypothetical protein
MTTRVTYFFELSGDLCNPALLAILPHTFPSAYVSVMGLSWELAVLALIDYPLEKLHYSNHVEVGTEFGLTALTLFVA